MQANVIKQRQTKYCAAIERALQRMGHATNTQLLEQLRTAYPDLSATTVHRVTSRLQQRGIIAEAPADNKGSMRFDTNTQPHDHFLCSNCQGIKDIDIADDVLPHLRTALGGCRIGGRLVIYGSCESCEVKGNRENTL